MAFPDSVTVDMPQIPEPEANYGEIDAYLRALKKRFENLHPAIKHNII